MKLHVIACFIKMLESTPKKSLLNVIALDTRYKIQLKKLQIVSYNLSI